MRAGDLAGDIVEAAIGTETSSALVSHHACDSRVCLEELEDYVNVQDGDKSAYERCPPHVWAGQAKKAGIPYHFATMEFGIADHKAGLVLELKR